jgi:hypothetical protein
MRIKTAKTYRMEIASTKATSLKVSPLIIFLNFDIIMIYVITFSLIIA